MSGTSIPSSSPSPSRPRPEDELDAKVCSIRKCFVTPLYTMAEALLRPISIESIPKQDRQRFIQAQENIITTLQSTSKQDAGKTRPVIVCPRIEGEGDIHYMYLAGTIDGHTEETIPPILREWVMPIYVDGLSTSTDDSIHTTPSWRMTGGRNTPCQWILLVPFKQTQPSDLGRWCSAGGEKYTVSPSELIKLSSASRDRMETLRAEVAENPMKIIELVERLSKSWDARWKTLRSSPRPSATPPSPPSGTPTMSPPSTPFKFRLEAPPFIPSSPESPCLKKRKEMDASESPSKKKKKTKTKAAPSTKTTDATTNVAKCNKRQRHIDDDGALPENVTIQRLNDSPLDAAVQAKQVPCKRRKLRDGRKRPADQRKVLAAVPACDDSA